MNDLNQKLYQNDYVQVMEKRIRYWAEKYDPHTTICDQQQELVTQDIAKENRKVGLSMIRAVFLNIF